MNGPTNLLSIRHPRDLSSPPGSIRTLASVTSRRSRRSLSTRRHANNLYNIHTRSDISPVFSPPLSPLLRPGVDPHPLSSSHNSYPYRNCCHLHSQATIRTAHTQDRFPRGPDHTTCSHCGIDPAALFPTHPWDHRQPWWTHLKQEYTIVKPYIEWQRKEKWRRKQNRRRQGKLKRQRFRPGKLKKTWKVELKRFCWRLTGWSHWEPSNSTSQPQQPKFNLVVTSEDTGTAQDDRNVQGHETRQELLREPEARTNGEPTDSSNARNRLGGLVGKLENKSPRYDIVHLLLDHFDHVEANARAIYGPARCLDIITYGSTSSRKIAAAIVEHNPTGRSYIHCCSAKEDTRLAALEHLLVIQEDIMQRLMDREGITSSGWLPATAQAQHARSFNSMSDLATSTHGLRSQAPSNAPSKAPSPSFSSVPSSAPSQPQPHRPGRVQWIMGSES